MKRNFLFYLKLFWSTFTLSAFTIGGGYVIVPLMRQKFVQKYNWLSEAEMLDITAIAQSSPGAIAVNASILVGYKLAGIPGAIMTIIGTILPPLVIISVISVFYLAFKENEIVHAVLWGLQVAVCAVISDVVVSMVAGVIKNKKLVNIIIMATAFVLAFFFKVNVFFIILACGALGALMGLYKKYRKESDN
ncbi:MAG TPA: chromate transporter [Clostridiales bacterium]|nr:chromate transporter [Clostridiales bacterium]